MGWKLPEQSNHPSWHCFACCWDTMANTSERGWKKEFKFPRLHIGLNNEPSPEKSNAACWSSLVLYQTCTTHQWTWPLAQPCAGMPHWFRQAVESGQTWLGCSADLKALLFRTGDSIWPVDCFWLQILMPSLGIKQQVQRPKTLGSCHALLSLFQPSACSSA